MSFPHCSAVLPVSQIPGAPAAIPDDDNAALTGYRPTSDPTQVHADETSQHSDQHSSDAWTGTANEHLASTFRHSGWAIRRARVWDAIRGVGGSAGRLERFGRCGCAAWVLRSVEGPARFRLASNRCRDRFCVPCALEHQRLVSSNLVKAVEGRELRFMTLTLRSTDAPLSEVITRLYRCFARLRRDRGVGSCMVGGLYFLELTLNNTTLQWHPHLHILYEGSYILLRTLTNTWHRITGDSFVVDLRAIRNSKMAAGYIAKYASKAIGSNVVFCPEKLAEAISGLAGRRVFNVFGTWKSMQLSKAPEDGLLWTCIGHLGDVMRDAKRGAPAALLILRQLRSTNVSHPITLFDHSP